MNLDGTQVAKFLEEFKGVRFIVSDFTSDHAQILADTALYYQTSMGPQFVLAGIPAIQIGHERYEDILVRNQLAPSVTDSEGLVVALGRTASLSQEDLKSSLGIREDWQAMLEHALSR